ncbi:Fusion glycoprotein [Dirofilaria immitis]
MNRFLTYIIIELIITSLLFGNYVVSNDEKNEETKIRKKRQFFGSHGSFAGISVPFFSMSWGSFGAHAIPPMWTYGPPPIFGYGPIYYYGKDIIAIQIERSKLVLNAHETLSNTLIDIFLYKSDAGVEGR